MEKSNLKAEEIERLNFLKAEEEERSNLIAVEKYSESASLRRSKTQHSALLRNLIDVMKQYQFAQTEYRGRCRDRIKRHFEISKLMYS